MNYDNLDYILSYNSTLVIKAKILEVKSYFNKDYLSLQNSVIISINIMFSGY